MLLHSICYGGLRVAMAMGWVSIYVQCTSSEREGEREEGREERRKGVRAQGIEREEQTLFRDS